jgi:hypothetical protein
VRPPIAPRAYSGPGDAAAIDAKLAPAMKPVTVSIDVPNPREDVYAFLDLLANH